MEVEEDSYFGQAMRGESQGMVSGYTMVALGHNPV